MKEELKVGIVGANRGSSFMLPFTETSETKATAICDINEDPLQEIGGKFSINQTWNRFPVALSIWNTSQKSVI